MALHLGLVPFFTPESGADLFLKPYSFGAAFSSPRNCGHRLHDSRTCMHLQKDIHLNEKALPLTMTGLAIVMAAIAGSGLFMAKGAMDKVSALEKQFVNTSGEQMRLSARLDELDAGLIALAKVSHIDGAELSSVMANELNEMRKTRGTVINDAPAQAEVTSQNEAPVLAIQGAVAGSDQASTNSPKAPMPKPGVEPSPAVTATTANPAASSPKAAQPSEDFETIVKNLQNEPPKAETANNPPIESKPTQSLTIADVDGILGARISEQWHKPAGSTENLAVEIHIKMARDGKLDKAEVTRSSGRDVFDRSAITALKSIGVVKEVAQLDDATFDRAYRSRTIVLK